MPFSFKLALSRSFLKGYKENATHKEIQGGKILITLLLSETMIASKKIRIVKEWGRASEAGVQRRARKSKSEGKSMIRKDVFLLGRRRGTDLGQSQAGKYAKYMFFKNAV